MYVCIQQSAVWYKHLHLVAPQPSPQAIRFAPCDNPRAGKAPQAQGTSVRNVKPRRPRAITGCPSPAFRESTPTLALSGSCLRDLSGSCPPSRALTRLRFNPRWMQGALPVGRTIIPFWTALAEATRPSTKYQPVVAEVLDKSHTCPDPRSRATRRDPAPLVGAAPRLHHRWRVSIDCTGAINGVVEPTRRLAHEIRSFINYRTHFLLTADGSRPGGSRDPAHSC